MTLTESPLTHQVVEGHYSTHQKLGQAGDQGTYIYGTEARQTSTTEPGNSTYLQQVDTAHRPKQPFTSNIAKYQQKR